MLPSFNDLLLKSIRANASSAKIISDASASVMCSNPSNVLNVCGVSGSLPELINVNLFGGLRTGMKCSVYAHLC